MHTVAIELIFYLARSTLLFTAYKCDLRHLRWLKGRTDTERGGQTLRRGTDTKGRVSTEVSLNSIFLRLETPKIAKRGNKH